MDNPVPTFSTQRGVPYAPQAASEFRAEEERRRRSEEREEARMLAKQARRERTLAHARYLDEVEHAWRELRQSRRGRSK